MPTTAGLEFSDSPDVETVIKVTLNPSGLRAAPSAHLNHLLFEPAPLHGRWLCSNLPRGGLFLNIPLLLEKANLTPQPVTLLSEPQILSRHRILVKFVRLFKSHIPAPLVQ
jgi:hypothetical protein